MENCASLGALHGYLSGDGYVIRNPPTQKQKYYMIGFRNTEERLLKDFQEQFENVFMEIPHICKSKDRCRKGSKLIYEFFTSRFGSFYSREWRMPEMTKECAAAWLRAFFDCEAWVVNIPSKDRSVALECVNHQGLKQIQTCLEQKFGIDSSLRSRKNRDTFSLGIHGKDDLTKFQKHIGFLHPKKRKELNEALASFDPWKWQFPTIKTEKELYATRILKEKLKFGQHNARIFSRKENLEKLQEVLREIFRIGSRIKKTKNGLGTMYHYLAFYGKENLDRLRELTSPPRPGIPSRLRRAP